MSEKSPSSSFQPLSLESCDKIDHTPPHALEDGRFSIFLGTGSRGRTRKTKTHKIEIPHEIHDFNLQAWIELHIRNEYERAKKSHPESDIRLVGEIVWNDEDEGRRKLAFEELYRFSEGPDAVKAAREDATLSMLSDALKSQKEAFKLLGEQTLVLERVTKGYSSLAEAIQRQVVEQQRLLMDLGTESVELIRARAEAEESEAADARRDAVIHELLKNLSGPLQLAVSRAMQGGEPPKITQED